VREEERKPGNLFYRVGLRKSILQIWRDVRKKGRRSF